MEADGPQDKWQLRYQRERNARKEAERLLEGKSLELYEANQKLAHKVARQDDQIRVENERFRLVFESSLYGIILHDLAGKILEANAMASQMLGYSSEELLTTPLLTLHPQEEHSATQSAIHKITREGSARFTSKFQCKDGRVFPAEITATRVQSQGQTLVQGTIRDMTQEHEAFRQIKLSQRAAQQANEAKTHFLATMSHELLTPLNGLIGFTHLLSKTTLAAEQREHLGLIEHCSHSLNSLVQDLLDFSSIENGKVQIENETFCAAPFFTRLVETHRMSASEKGIALALSLSQLLPETLDTDPARLRQVIANLLSNAVKYSTSGLIELLVEVAGSQLLISVRDEGVGLPSFETDRLFEPYNRGSEQTQRLNEGTGLGLAISRKLCEAMGGSITASNRLKGGAEFKVVLPLTAQSDGDGDGDGGGGGGGGGGDSHPASSPKQAPMPSRTHDPAETPLLIAEDNPINAQLLKILLTKKGYPVTTVPDGEEALLILQQNPTFRLLLADLNMPRRDGFSLTQAIRAGEAGAHYQTLPIVAVSANLLEEDREKALAVGMDSFLPKPIKPARLADCLNEAIPPEKKSP